MYSAQDPSMTLDSLSVHTKTPIRIRPSLNLTFISLFSIPFKYSVPLEYSEDVLIGIASDPFSLLLLDFEARLAVSIMVKCTVLKSKTVLMSVVQCGSLIGGRLFMRV